MLIQELITLFGYLSGVLNGSISGHYDARHDSPLGVSRGSEEHLVLGRNKLTDLVGKGVALGHIVVIELGTHHVT